MSLRGLLVLIGLLALAIVVLLRAGRTPEKPKPEPDAALLPPFTEDAVRAVDVRCGAESVELTRSGARAWRLHGAVDAEADPRRVHEIVSALHDARIVKVIAEKAGDASGFGLQPAACTVRLDLGAAPATLRLGRSSPVGSERYASADDGRVVLTGGSLFSTLARGAEAFREKRLVPVPADEITRLAVERPDARIVVTKVGDGWQVESPRRDTASSGACGNLARGIAAIEISDAGTTPPPGDVRPDRRIKIDVMTAAGGAPLTAFIATAGIGGKRVAWRGDGRFVGLIDETAAQDLLRPPESFYETRIATFSLPDVKRLTITRDGSTLALARARESEPWAGTEGPSTFAVDGNRVVDFLNKLRSLTASGFEKAPATPAGGALAVEGAGGDLARLTYGPLAGGAFWVTTPKRPGTVFHVDQAALGAIPAKADLQAKP